MISWPVIQVFFGGEEYDNDIYFILRLEALNLWGTNTLAASSSSVSDLSSEEPLHLSGAFVLLHDGEDIYLILRTPNKDYICGGRLSSTLSAARLAELRVLEIGGINFLKI